MRRLLAHRDARVYLIGQVCSLWGDSCLWLAMGIWVKSLTHSNAAAGLTLFFVNAPSLGAPLAGLLVDRVRRRPLMLAVNALTGVSVLALLLVHGRGEVWLVYAVMTVYGVSYTVLGPAQSALLTLMVPTELLADANGTLRTVQEALRLLGPLAGTALFVAVGAHAIAVIDAATFVVPIVTLAMLRVGEPAPEPASEHIRAELLAGLRHVWRTLQLRQVVIAGACSTAVFGLMETITYAIAGTGLHRPPSFVGILVAVQGAGAVAGGVTAASMLRRLGETRLVAAGMLVAAAGAALELPPSLPCVLAGAIVFGAAIPWLVVGLITLCQRLSPPALQGRVYAAMDMLITTPQTASIALGAALIGATGYRPLLLAISAGMLLAAGYLITRARVGAGDRVSQTAAPALMDGDANAGTG